MAAPKTLLKVTQEKLPASQIGLEVEIPAELSQQAYDQVINKYMRSADIPGFRKGKVPRQVILQRLGQAQLKAAAVEELVQSSLEKAIAQEKISALGNFQLRSDFEKLVGDYQPGVGLTFSATVDVSPEVKLGQYKGLKVTAQPGKYDSAQVDAVLTEQQQERATLIPVEDRPAQAADVVQVDFVGKLVPLEGESETSQAEDILGGQATDFQLELKPDRFIPGFVEGVFGMAIGETREVPVTFPNDYFQEELAGKQAVFTITLKDIKEKELPTLDDDFAQEISEFQTLVELRQFLENRYQNEAEQQTESNVEEALLAELLKVVEVELPETLIKNEVNFLLTQLATRFQSQGVDPNQLFTEEMLPRLREQSRPEAIQRIKRSLALAEVAKQESLQVEAQQIEERYQTMLKQFDNRKVDRQRLREVVAEELVEAKVVQWLKDQAEVEIKEAEPESQPESEPQLTAEASNASAAVVDVKSEAVTTATVESSGAHEAEEGSSSQQTGTAAESPAPAKAAKSPKTSKSPKKAKQD